MRNEQVFNKDGFYLFVVKSNAVLHKEASEQGAKIIEKMLAELNIKASTVRNKSPITILDLACGGMPVSICKMAADFPDTEFTYLGIDINPDQVNQAKHEFQYPKNFVEINILEGNAWDLEELIQEKRHFDIIFTGMNLHHGTPEEILFLARQIKSLLSPSGIFINHDIYRPDDEDYIRRPDYNPRSPDESYMMLDKSKLSDCSISVPGLNSSPSAKPDWRRKFLDKYKQMLLARGGDLAGIESTIRHVLERDFSLSPSEMCSILEFAGFRASFFRYSHSSEPMKDYYAMIVGKAAEN